MQWQNFDTMTIINKQNNHANILDEIQIKRATKSEDILNDVIVGNANPWKYITLSPQNLNSDPAREWWTILPVTLFEDDNNQWKYLKKQNNNKRKNGGNKTR